MKIIIKIKPRQNTSKSRGIGVYTRELVQALNKYYKKDEFILTSNLDAVADYDLLHYPFFDPFFHTLKPPKNTKTVVTIHDVIPLKFPDHFPSGMKGSIRLYFQKKALEKVNHIITDSESSKNDIAKYLMVQKSKISTILLAPSSTTSKLTKSLENKVAKKYNLPEKFILYVGDINWNKNVVGLINAHAALKNDIPLILVGKALKEENGIPELNSINEAINNSGKSALIKKLGYIPDHHQPALYSRATVYVQPSFYEGFGLTILEAMSNNCPVISSDQGSLPEVAGDAALFFNPYHEDSLKKALERLLGSSQARRALVKKGVENVKRFSWQETARRTHKIYEEIINAASS